LYCLEVLADATSSQVVSLAIEEHPDQWVATSIPEVPITIPNSLPNNSLFLRKVGMVDLLKVTGFQWN